MVILEGGININNRPFILSAIRWRGVAAIFACIMDGTTPGPPKVNTHCRCMVLMCLGLPPCFSFDVHPAFVTCVIHGDDIVCQTRCATIDNLCDRTCQTIEGGLLGRSIGWMSQAVSLAVLGLRSNHVSTDIKLVIPGQVYLVRPRRMGGGSSSIHEVGQVGRVGRDVALSRSPVATERYVSY